ncbi:MAG TPA: hypothetical protein VGM27_04005, partial [Acidobacteriaceae bacterium]
APSLQDQRQRFVVSALWDLPIGDADDPGNATASHNPWVRAFSNIEVAPIFSVATGMPVNPLTGVDSGLAYVFPFAARPFGLGRNSLRMPLNADLDLRVLRTVRIWRGKLDLVAESFNLLNHTNVTDLNPSFGSSLDSSSWFGRPIAASAPRQIQFSLDYEF